MSSHNKIQTALTNKRQLWGGWIISPSSIGPEVFAEAGFDYVGIDVQHSTLSDADVASMVLSLEHLPIATIVRLPTADPAPIGRVIDAGADAVIVAMIESAEQAAAAVSATRFPPRGVRSFGPLRASMGTDPEELDSQTCVFAMIETTRGLDALEEICAVPGLAGVYIGPMDLTIALGYKPAEAWSTPAIKQTMARIQQAAQSAGIIAGIHAGTGTIAADVAEMGFQVVTVVAEAHALLRGASLHRREAENSHMAAADEPVPSRAY